MSKYHERIAAIGHDWTTIDGITAALQDKLELRGYWTEFQVLRGGAPVDEETARQAIIGVVTSPPIIEKYRSALQKMDSGVADGREAFVKATQTTGGLVFNHGHQQLLMDFGEFEVISKSTLEERLKRRNKTEEKRENRGLELKKKLDETQRTDKDFYLFHANQCGYLVRNTTIRFNASAEGQFGTSTMTHIAGITLPELQQEFIDSAGMETLSAISTHINPDLVRTTEEDGARAGIMAMHSDFAKAIIDFLNLENEVDIDDLKRQHRESESDSGFQPIGHWGADREKVLGMLLKRRSDLNPREIEEQFEDGYNSLGYGVLVAPLAVPGDA